VRAVVQRVSRASVTTGGRNIATIGSGLVVLVAVAPGDTPAIALKMAEKVTGLRIFEDASGKMNRAVGDCSGSVLAVSQFTLYGDTRRGRRPSFESAARPEVALPLYRAFCLAISAHVPCLPGAFGEHMELELVNDGPVTLIIDSDDFQRPRRT